MCGGLNFKRNGAQIHAASIQKAAEMVTSSAPKPMLEAGGRQQRKKGAPALPKGNHFGATCSIWIIILGPAGQQRGSKSILFGIKLVKNVKNEPPKSMSGKTSKND